MNYKVIHKGEGEFISIMEDNSQKEIGDNLKGMIKYTYFDHTDEYPEVNWSIDNQTLLKDYHNKVYEDMLSGKLKEDIDKGNIWIEKLF